MKLHCRYLNDFNVVFDMGVGKRGVLGVQTPPEIKDTTNLKYIL